jgi:putative aminopeptidase FrvX
MQRGATLRRSIPLVVASAALLASCLRLDAQKIEYSKATAATLEERLNRVTDKNPEREQVLRELFEKAGCAQEQLVEQRVKGSRTPNVICTLKGTEENSIVVGAHYDKVSNGDGVVDNWSGASLLPSLYQGLKSKARRLTFVFVGFTDEERGLVGSRFFVKELSAEDKSKIRAMVNIDSLGLSDTKVWVARADKALVEAAGAVAHAVKLPVAAVNVDKVGESDSRPFLDNRIPVIDFHSVTQETLPILHSTRDAISAIRLPEYENTYALLVAYLAYLDLTMKAGGEVPQSSKNR